MTPITLLPTTSTIEQIDIQGDPVKAGAWYGIPSGQHTIAIYVQNFTGRIYIEGTLSNDPSYATWFPIDPGTGQDYVEFPLTPNAATSIRGGDNGVYGFTFTANALWLRARVERAYYLTSSDLTSDEIAALGSVRKIMMCV